MRQLRFPKAGSPHVNALAFSLDSRFLAAGSDSAGSRVWEVTATRPRIQPIPRSVCGIFFTSDAGLLIVPWTGNSRTVAPDDTVTFPEPLDRRATVSAAISADGRLYLRAIMSGSDCTVVCRDVRDGRLLWSEGPRRGAGWRVRCAGGRVAVIDWSGLRLLDQETGRRLATMTAARFGGLGLRGVALSPDGSCIASAVGGVVVICEADSGKIVTRLPSPGETEPPLLFSPDGRTLFTAAVAGRVRSWETAGWREQPEFDAGVGSVRSLAASPDGMLLAAGGTEGRLAVWDAG